MQDAAITLRSLDSARDDDTGKRAISHWLSSFLVEDCPCGADPSSAFGAPLLQGATLLACKKRNLQEKLVKSKIREYHFPRIVISSEARNLPCTPVKRWLWDNDETKNDFCASSSMQDAATTLRSLGFAFDDDTGRRTISHWPSSLPVEGCPCGADLSSAFGAPLLQGATLLTCKNAICKRKISKT